MIQKAYIQIVNLMNSLGIFQTQRILKKTLMNQLRKLIAR